MAVWDNKIDGASLLKRFSRNLRKSRDLFDGTPCWEWTACANSKGYPQISVGGRMLYAHRVSFELFVGAPGPHVHHKCLNQRCVNPAHLTSTTADENRALQAAGVGVMPVGGFKCDEDAPF